MFRVHLLALNCVMMQEVNGPVLHLLMELGNLVCRYLVAHLKVEVRRYYFSRILGVSLFMVVWLILSLM